ncbi:MAG: hypothetical protein P8020_07270 [Acidobacteriota bacterium]
MPKPGSRFWIGVAVSILGFAVGLTNLMRGLGEEINNRDVAIGALCIALAAGWLAYLLLELKRGGRR